MSQTAVLPFSDEELKTYLQKVRVVIATPQVNAGRSIRKFILQFGAKSDSVLVPASFAEAALELEREATHLLLVDLSLTGGEPLELVKLQAAKFPHRLEISTLLLTPDPSSATSAMIAETQADAALVLPFNYDGFKAAFFQAIEHGVRPTEYRRRIETGKQALQENRIEDARAEFQAAKLADAKPTLAWFYLGEIQRRNSEWGDALRSYGAGLALDPSDYRCLSGCFDVQMATRDYSGAYATAELIHAHFPVSAGRILDLVKLSVYLRKFADVIDYWNIFRRLEKRDETLNRVVIAGLLVCAKYFHLKDQPERGREVLADAAKMSRESGALQPDVLRYLVDVKNYADADRFLAEFPPELLRSPDVELLGAELAFARGDDNEVVRMTTQLNSAVATSSARAHELLIASSMRLGRSSEVLEKLRADAHRRFPTVAR